MNFEDGFESLGRKKAAGPSPAVGDQTEAEDLLFAVPDESEEALRNPYGDDDGFDDLAMGDGGGISPQAFDGDAFAAGGSAAGSDSGLENLFLDAPGGAADGEVETEVMPGLMRGYGEFTPPAADAPSEAVCDAFAPLETDLPSTAAAASVGASVGASASPSTAPPLANEPGTIPGRNRVSYSQGAARKQYRPTPDRLESPVSSSLLWVLPFTAFLSGACFSAYYFLRVGSPVLAGVSFVVGALAAMFCRVLFRR